MTYEEFNAFCGGLPATTYVVQWGGAHVWKVGGKVFAIGGWDTGTAANRVVAVKRAKYSSTGTHVLTQGFFVRVTVAMQCCDGALWLLPP